MSGEPRMVATLAGGWGGRCLGAGAWVVVGAVFPCRSGMVRACFQGSRVCASLRAPTVHGMDPTRIMAGVSVCGAGKRF